MAPGLLAFVLVAMLACESGSDDAATPGRTTSTSSAASSTSVSPPTSAAPTGPPATRGPRAITVGPITFHTPADWDVFPGPSSNRPPVTTTFLGVVSDGPNGVYLRVMTAYPDTVESLLPTRCIDDPTVAPTSVELIDSGFGPVGTLTAEYRKWRFDCPGAAHKADEQRVWFLPISQIAIVEQHHTPEILDVVTTAEVT